MAEVAEDKIQKIEAKITPFPTIQFPNVMQIPEDEFKKKVPNLRRDVLCNEPDRREDIITSEASEGVFLKEQPAPTLEKKLEDETLVIKEEYTRAMRSNINKIFQYTIMDDMQNGRSQIQNPFFQSHLKRYNEAHSEGSTKTNKNTIAILYTIRPPHDYPFVLLEDFMVKATRKFEDIIYCFEISKYEDKNPIGFHVHMLINRPQDVVPSYLTKTLKGYYETIYRKKPTKISFDVRSCETTTQIENRVNYIKGIDIKEKKEESNANTIQWRQDNEIEPYYTQGSYEESE